MTFETAKTGMRHWAAAAHRSPALQVKTLFHQALSAQHNGDIETAAGCYRRIIHRMPTFVAAHYNLGLILFQRQNWGAAAAHFRSAVVLKPDFAEAAFNLGVVRQAQGLPDQAAAAYRQALALKPDFIPAGNKLGLLFFNAGQYTKAVETFKQVLERVPDNHLVLNNLGLALHQCNRLDSAIEIFQRAIAVKPDFVKAYHNLGNVYLDLEQQSTTIQWYRKALDVTPRDPRAHLEIGKLYLEHSDLHHARQHFQTATDLAPDFAQAWVSLATTALMQGDFDTGWKLYPWRFRTADHKIRIYPHRLEFPLWRGEPFKDKRLLIHCEQGMGDTIQFARLLPLVKSRGGYIVFQVQPPLLPLFAGWPHIDLLLPLTDAPPDDRAADLYVPLLDLPGCLEISSDTIPHKIPYLFAQDRKTRQWKRHIDARALRVGIVWSGNRMHARDRQRSCPSAMFAPLGQLPGIQLYTLQKEAPVADQTVLTSNCNAIHLGDRLLDFADTAAALQCLDLVITVDTAVAHLAGAMGIPVWVLLHHVPDWRWMLHRSDAPWYPTMKLFRQPKSGDWEAVFNALITALGKQSAKKPRR